MRTYIGRIVAAILMIAGIVLLLYPTAASWVYQYRQIPRLDNYSTVIDHTNPAAEEHIAMAHHYNDALKSGADLLPNARFPQATGGLEQDAETSRLWPYEDILKVGEDGLMGRILIPAAEVDLPIYHGSNDETLLKGAGHLEGTSLPVGGEGTRTVITAHRGLANATMFTHLDRVKVGDSFTLNIFGDVLSYRVIETKVVEPDDVDSIRPVVGKDLATLVTCTPLGINTQRILVTGERVYPTPVEDEDAAKAESTLPKFPWWVVELGAVLLVGLIVIVHSSYKIAKIRRQRRLGGANAAQAGARAADGSVPGVADTSSAGAGKTKRGKRKIKGGRHAWPKFQRRRGR